jgi:indole-3-glycerol phosphate synthase
VVSATILQDILQSTREELERRKLELPLDVLQKQGHARACGPCLQERPFHSALRRPGMGVIAEFKRRSPSAGTLAQEPDIAAIVSAYERGGACAVSVLTEGPNFDGSLEDLVCARGACDLPILRKDFIVDPYQLYEARATGADAILLIVAALDPGQLASLYECAGALGLDVLVEVHDAEELQAALAVGAQIIGVNNRDLRDFTVDTGRTVALMARMPEHLTVVSESGISTREQLSELEGLGVSAVLVGGSLMRSPDPSAALQSLLRRG